MQKGPGALGGGGGGRHFPKTSMKPLVDGLSPTPASHPKFFRNEEATARKVLIEVNRCKEFFNAQVGNDAFLSGHLKNMSNITPPEYVRTLNHIDAAIRKGELQIPQKYDQLKEKQLQGTKDRQKQSSPEVGSIFLHILKDHIIEQDIDIDDIPWGIKKVAENNRVHFNRS